MLLIGYRLSPVGDKADSIFDREPFPIVNSAEIQRLQQACNEQSVENGRHNHSADREIKGTKTAERFGRKRLHI